MKQAFIHATLALFWLQLNEQQFHTIMAQLSILPNSLLGLAGLVLAGSIAFQLSI